MSRGGTAFSVVAFTQSRRMFPFGGSSATAAAQEVTICHRTNSDTNPYVQISPAAQGLLNGHSKQTTRASGSRASRLRA